MSSEKPDWRVHIFDGVMEKRKEIFSFLFYFVFFLGIILAFYMKYDYSDANGKQGTFYTFVLFLVISVAIFFYKKSSEKKEIDRLKSKNDQYKIHINKIISFKDQSVEKINEIKEVCSAENLKNKKNNEEYSKKMKDLEVLMGNIRLYVGDDIPNIKNTNTEEERKEYKEYYKKIKNKK